MDNLSGSAIFVVAAMWTIVMICYFMWYLWSLSMLFPKIGLPSWAGWVPVWNQWQLIQRGGLPGWLVLLGLIPGVGIVALVVLIIAINRINAEHHKGPGFTVLGILLPPLWAMLLTSHISDTAYASPSQRSFQQATPGVSGLFSTQGMQPAHNGANVHGLPPVPPQAFQQPQPPQPGAFQHPVQPQPLQPVQPVQPPPATTAPQFPVPQAPAPPPPAVNQVPPAAAQTPANNWGFGTTTEGAFERLAAEEAQRPGNAPLGVSQAQRQFSWPSPDQAQSEEIDARSPLVLPEPSAEEADHDAPSIFDTGNSQQGVSETATSAPELLSQEAWTPVEPDRTNSAPAPHEVPTVEDELDRTVVVARKTRWGLELPDGEMLELLADDVVLGRKPDAQEGTTVLQIVDPTRTMSKTHARLRRDEDTWTIEDLQSTNGVATVDAQGRSVYIDTGHPVVATERLVIGTLEVKLRVIE